MVCAATGLHAYQAARRRGHVLQQLWARQLLPADDHSVLIHRDEMKYRLAEIDTDDIQGIRLMRCHPRIVAQMGTLRRTISLRLELAGMRKDVAFASEQFGLSERRACKLLDVDRSTYRSTYRYEPRPDRNADLREALVALARQKPRYGYRRLHVVLEKRGHSASVNADLPAVSR